MSKKRVLIVEDAPNWQDLLPLLLNANGHKVVATVDTADAAIAAAKEHKPDVITMDNELADKSSGLQAAKEIRTFDPNVKIIMLSGAGETFEGLGFKKSPFPTAEFLAVIEEN